MRKAQKGRIYLSAGLIMAMLMAGCGEKTDKINQAMEAVKDLDYREALVLLDEAEAAGENQRLIQRGMGIAYMGLTRYEDAVACFEKALAGSNGLVENVDFDVNYYLAVALQKLGRFEDAEKVYDAILALRPKEKDAHYLRGNVRLELDKFNEAVADFDKAIEMDPRNYDRLIEICQVLTHYGYKQKGQEYIKAAMASGDKLTAYDTGRFYYYLEDFEKAYVALEEAKNDGGAEGTLYLGRAYEATGDYNYASTVYSAYLNKYGDNAEVYNQLGVCEMKKQEYEKALSYFEKGLDMKDSATLQSLSFNQAVAYEFLQEYDKARDLLQAYLNTYPDDEAAKREMEFLKSR